MNLKDKSKEELTSMFSHIIDQYDLIDLKFKTHISSVHDTLVKDGNIWLNLDVEGIELKISMKPKDK